jgi:hypothetical protein
MTKLRRSTTILCLVSAIVVLDGSSSAQTRPAIAEQLAKTYGLDSFGQIDAIRYTFNAEFPGVNLSRSWVWQPKTGEISYEGKDKDGKPVKLTYVQSKLDSEPANVKNEIDPAFYNDNYWLLLPLHVYWDPRADVQDKGAQKLPLGNGSAKQVVVKYPSEGGFSPGDTWELYIAPDSRIAEMVFHRGGTMKPSTVIAAWAGYQKAGPLLISTDHRGTADDKPLHVSLSNVAVKLTGSETWVNAQ